MENEKTCDCQPEKPKITPEMRVALREGFPQEGYSQHPTKTFLTTLKAMYVVERINSVFGIGRWDLPTSIVVAENGYVLMSGRLVIFDYDCVVPMQYGGHTTTGKNTELADGYKSAITDILSKSASYLEIGIDLFQGKINAGKAGKQQSNNQGKPAQEIKEAGPDLLTQSFVADVWNGKLYANDTVYINNVQYKVPSDKVEQLKSHNKFKP